MTPALTLLAIIALVLHILFGYLLPPPANGGYYRNVLALIVVIVVILIWRGAL